MSNRKDITKYLMQGKFKEASGLIEKFIETDKRVDELILQHRVIKYWINHLETIEKIKDPYEKGTALLEEWKEFLKYANKSKLTHLNEINAIHYFVHKKASEFFIEARNKKNENDIDLLLKIAYCLKEIGNYDESIEVLKYAYKLNKNNVNILTMLADCYFLKGEYDISRLFFKEVFFFQNPLEINFEYITSDKIYEIVDLVKKNGWKDFEVIDWIPIYGMITGFFNIRRELKNEEVKKIHFQLNELELHFYREKPLREKIEPILLKKYLLLIEYYTYQVPDKIKREQYFNKIKNINPVFYDKLIDKI